MRGRSLGTPKSILVVLDQSNPCVTRSRSQIPMPDPSTPSRKRSSRTGSSDAGCTMVVTFRLRCCFSHAADDIVDRASYPLGDWKIPTCSIRGYYVAVATSAEHRSGVLIKPKSAAYRSRASHAALQRRDDVPTKRQGQDFIVRRLFTKQPCTHQYWRLFDCQFGIFYRRQ